MKQKYVYFDTETGGVDPKTSALLSLAMIYECGDVREELCVYIRPGLGKECNPIALQVNGFTTEEIENSDRFISQRKAYEKIIAWLGPKINKFDRKDKAWLVGYNSQAFDTPFLVEFFREMNDQYFFSWFWSDNLDVRVLAASALRESRRSMKNFKLMTVAKHLNLEVDESQAHDALYDVKITREVFKALTAQAIQV